jgi:arylsulfatase A-like enzyme
MKKITTASFILFSAALAGCQHSDKKEKPNVLFIAVDDLRPELGCYGHQQIMSPNIDKLAANGLTFVNAYCNVPVCGASRASLLTGIRPTQNRFVDFDAWAEKDVPGAVSLPQVFRNNGYHTISNGKVFHHLKDIRESWSEGPWNPVASEGNYLNYLTVENLDLLKGGEKRGFPYEVADVDDDAYFDGQIAEKSIKDLKRLKKEGKPFFLAAGFLKPHLPFNAPKKYWDLYPEETIHLPDNYYRPKNAPDVVIHNFGELRSYYGVPAEGPVSDEMAHQLIHGYYACVSYTDAQIGKLIQALEDFDLAKNTIVVLWGDHGWQLGEHTLWCKHSNFKTSLNTPLIISAPGYNGDQKTEALVEFVDIFPSLCELTGLDQPAQLQGKSFVPLMINPQMHWKEAVYSRFIQGESVKTSQYLFTEWYDNNGKIYSDMLYDHLSDPSENLNISGEVSLADTVRKLQEMLNIQILKSREIQLDRISKNKIP